MQDNPYSAPSSALSESGAAAGDLEVARSVLEQLERTRPWVHFAAVLLFIGVAAMLALAAVAIVVGLGGVGAREWGTARALGFGLGTALVYGVVAALHALLGAKLWSYAGRITALAASRSGADLARALDAQRSFWKSIGVMAIVGIAGYALLFAVVVAAGVLAD